MSARFFRVAAPRRATRVHRAAPPAFGLAFLVVALGAAALLAGCGHGGSEPSAELTAADAATDSLGPARAAAGTTDGRALKTGSTRETDTAFGPRPAPDSTAVTAAAPAPAPPDSSAALRLTARVAALVAANDFVRARDLLAAATAPGDEAVSADRAAALLAWVELRGDEVARAVAPARAAWQADSTRAARLNNYGITRLQAGDVAGAERAFRAALERAPALPGPYYNMTILSAFYRMDAAEGRRWFARYQERATDDPDRLDQALAEAGADSAQGDEK